jgi:hypothetical protein
LLQSLVIAAAFLFSLPASGPRSCSPWVSSAQISEN